MAAKNETSGEEKRHDRGRRKKRETGIDGSSQKSRQQVEGKGKAWGLDSNYNDSIREEML